MKVLKELKDLDTVCVISENGIHQYVNSPVCIDETPVGTIEDVEQVGYLVFAEIKLSEIGSEKLKKMLEKVENAD